MLHNQTHIDSTLSKQEHDLILKSLELHYLGHKTPDNTTITHIYVDYHKSHQYLNRAEDEYGNLYFITELRKESSQNDTTIH